MGLKEHTTDSDKLSEGQIESIIAGYIKYDPAKNKVVFLPKAKELSAIKKILLYMVALRGWEFVVDKEPPPSSAQPQQIGQETGMPGGTIRPVLKRLTDSNLLSYEHGRYEAPAHNLQNIGEIISGSTMVRNQVASRSGKKDKDDEKPPTKKKLKKVSSKGSLAEAIKKLIDNGWFKGGKTSKELREQLHLMTINVPVSQLPWYLINAYRSGKLERDYIMRDGKEVLVYSQD